MILGFNLGRGLVGQGFMHTGGVPPVHPVHGFEFDLGGGWPGGASINQLGLIQTIDCLGQGIVIGIASRANRSSQACLGKVFGIANADILRSAVGINSNSG